MYNILGPKNFKGEYKPIVIDSEENVFLKMYGKKESKPKRKLGHRKYNRFKKFRSIEALLNKIESIKKSVNFVAA